MKAVVCKKYGSPEVLKLMEVPKPIPKRNEVCIKIKATAVNSADIRVRKFDVPISFWLPARFALGLFRPKYQILGIVSSGVIESVGADVKQFKTGDEVFATSDFERWGGYAEYLCLKETGAITLKPEKLTYEEAASIIFGGLTAIEFLGRAGLKSGQKILIYGASGSVGIATVQLAKYFGAEVTGVCSGRNIKLVQSQGADRVIDYQADDFSKIKERFDVVFDAVGKAALSDCLRVLKKGGVYLNAVDTPGMMIRMRWASWTKGIRLWEKGYKRSEHQNIRADVFKQIKEYAEKGAFKPIIDRSYPLEQIVEAHRYVEKGHKKGNITIKLHPDL